MPNSNVVGISEMPSSLGIAITIGLQKVGEVCYHRHMDKNCCFNPYCQNKTVCCWNKRNGLPVHNDDCLTAYGPQFRDASMAVTFTDGVTIIYKSVRVCINRPHNDGIRVDGTTVEFETGDGTCFTVVGVRQYVYTIEGE